MDGVGSLYVVGSTEGAFAGQTNSGSYDTFVLKMPDAPLLTMTPPDAAADITLGGTPTATLTPVPAAGFEAFCDDLSRCLCS